MTAAGGDHPSTAPRSGAGRCPRCNRSGPRCFCPRLPRIANRTLLRILQHPREQRHRAGTAPFVHGALQRCDVVVARESAGRIQGAIEVARGCALLYPGADSLDLETLPAGREPTELLVLDGTWSQAKRLYHDNPWLHELPKVHLDPELPSRYLIRREPQPDYLSTVESVVEALGVLEPELRAELDRLRTVFEAVMAEQHGLMIAVDRSPRMQRPRQREDRRVPPAFLDEPFWVVHTEQVWCEGPAGRALQPVHWGALEVGSGRVFEAVLRPTDGEPDAVHLGHIGLESAEVAAGEDPAHALARFVDAAGERPSLCAWSRLPLRVLRGQGLEAGRELLVKVLCANLVGRIEGGPEGLAARLGITAHRPALRGRGAARLGSVWSLARWVRERSSGS